MLKVAIPDQISRDEFIDETMTGVVSCLHSYGSKPSEQHENALAAVVSVLHSIAIGSCDAAMYVCSLDVGMGKTVTLSYSVQSIRKHFPEVGIVLCLGRLEQIEAMIDQLELQEHEFAVLAGKSEAAKGERFRGKLFAEMGLGEGRIHQAPLLLTTHKQLELRLHGSTWAEARAFWFKGKPRPIRVWDEAISLRRHFTIGEYQLHKALGCNTSLPKVLRVYLEQIFDLLRNAEADSIIDLPDIGEDDLDVWSILQNLPEQEYRQVGNIIRDAAALAGKKNALVVKDSEDKVYIQYDVNLPADLFPILVLDASANDRRVYSEQPEQIVRLPHAEKRYDNVTAIVVSGDTGKRAFWNKYEERIADSAEFIKQHTDYLPLIIHPKEETSRKLKGSIDRELEKHLSEDQLGKLKRIHWGIHTSVNSYANCNLVDCLTLWHAPRHVYRALGIAASNADITVSYGKDKLDAVEVGELCSELRQALGRSCIRKTLDNQAPHCIIRLRVPIKGPLKKLLRKLFPGINIVNEQGDTSLSDKVISFLEKLDVDEVTHPDVYRSFDIQQPHFSRLINTPSFMHSLRAIGWENVRSRPSKLIRKTI